MSLNQHFKKRKSRTSSASNASARRPVTCTPSTTTTTLSIAVDASPLKTDSSSASAASHATTATTSASQANSESASLAAALTALQVSLTREFESFTPPTPAVSPAHRTSAKRARFDFPGIDECEPVPEVQGKVSPAPKARGALLAVSARIKFELEKHLRKNSERSQQRPKKRKQLSYFAIVGAFHQAAHERSVGLKTHSLDRTVDTSVVSTELR